MGYAEKDKQCLLWRNNKVKFKVGDKVRVICKAYDEGLSWQSKMDLTIGKVYNILYINLRGSCQLDTGKDAGSNWHYLPISLRKESIKGQQLVFDFMYE